MLVIASLLDGAVPHAVLDNLVVDAPYRGRGIGRMLINGVRRAARGAGAAGRSECSTACITGSGDVMKVTTHFHN